MKSARCLEIGVSIVEGWPADAGSPMRSAPRRVVGSGVAKTDCIDVDPGFHGMTVRLWSAFRKTASSGVGVRWESGCVVLGAIPQGGEGRTRT